MEEIKSMRWILWLTVFGMVIGTAISQAQADYTMTALNRFVSSNERLVDASPSGWAIIQNLDDANLCTYRVNIYTRDIVNLCEKGFNFVAAVNDKGVVVGRVNHTTIATWSSSSGLLKFKRPRYDFGLLTPTDINDNGWVVGYSSKKLRSEPDENGYSVTEYEERPLLWRDHGVPDRIRIPRQRKARPVAINNKQTVLIQSSYFYLDATSGGYALYMKKQPGHVKRISSNSDAMSSGMVSLNNLDQVSSSNGLEYIYSPHSGWREVVSSVACGRCDLGGYSTISDSGAAIFFDGTSPTLAEYPRPAIELPCLLPQNRLIQNTTLTVSKLDSYYSTAYGQPRFLEKDKILFSTHLKDDGQGERLLLMEKDTNSTNSIYNYCPEAIITRDEDERFDCYAPTSTSEVPVIADCKGNVAINSMGSALPPLEVQILAKQNTFSDQAECPVNFVDSIALTSSQSRPQFSLQIDPGFEYFLSIKDPRFRLMDTSITYYGTVVTSPIQPCRAPLEGLVNGRHE